MTARNDPPATNPAQIEAGAKGQRIGVARGKFKPPEPDKALDAEIAASFERPVKLG